MATNDFLPFANGGGANVLTQAQYAALTTLLSGGYQSGVANSTQMNKTWRQSSIMAAVLGQFAADYSGNNSVDDGTTTTLEANLVAAIRNATKTGVILADTGAANAYAAVNAPPLIAGTWVDGVIQQVKIAHANTGASTYAPDGLTAIPIYGLGLQPLQGGELALNGTAVLMRATIAGVNSGNPIAVLMECAGGASQVAPATQSQHAMQFGQATGRLLNVQVFTSSGTYTPTAGTNSVIVEAVGGGGGSGGNPAQGSGSGAFSVSGAGGSYAKARYTSGFGGVAVTVGAAGTAGTATTSGGTGGTTSFGSLMSCPGGTGGTFGGGSTGFTAVNGASAPAAATVTGGSTIANIGGGAGGGGFNSTSGGAAVSGAGGSSALGVGAPGIGSVGSFLGASGTGYGAGACGAYTGASGSATTGGAGTPGVLIVYEYA